MFRKNPTASERSRSSDRQMSPATLTPTRASVARNIHRRRRPRLWFFNYPTSQDTSIPWPSVSALGRWTLRSRRRSKRRSSMVAADERSRTNCRTSQNARRRRQSRRSFVGNICRGRGRTLSDSEQNPSMQIEAKITPLNLALSR